MNRGIHIALASVMMFLNLQGFASIASADLKGAQRGEWTMDYDAAIQLAEQENRRILMYFTSRCPHCSAVERDILTTKAFKDYAAANLVLISIDFNRKEGAVPEAFNARNRVLAQVYGVAGKPTFVFLESDGQTVIGRLGSGRERKPAIFIENLEILATLTPTGIEDYIKAHPTKAQAFMALIDNADRQEAALNEWMSTEPERNAENDRRHEEMLARINAAQADVIKFLKANKPSQAR